MLFWVASDIGDQFSRGFFWLKGFLRIDARAFCLDVLGSELFSFEWLDFSVLCLLGQLAALGVCRVPSPCSWGVEIQKISKDSSDLDIVNYGFTYCMNHRSLYLGDDTMVLGWLVFSILLALVSTTRKNIEKVYRVSQQVFEEYCILSALSVCKRWADDKIIIIF